jgi:hypothetical protein
MFPRIQKVFTMPNLLSRTQAAQFLTERGFTTASSTLARLACQGGGPPIIKYGRWARYDQDELLRWARTRSVVRLNTSDTGKPFAAAY